MNVNTNLIIFLFAAAKLDLIIIIIFPIVRLWVVCQTHASSTLHVCARLFAFVQKWNHYVYCCLNSLVWDLKPMLRMVYAKASQSQRKKTQRKTPISIWTNILTSKCCEKNTVIFFFILRRILDPPPFGMRWCVRVRAYALEIFAINLIWFRQMVVKAREMIIVIFFVWDLRRSSSNERAKMVNGVVATKSTKTHRSFYDVEA